MANKGRAPNPPQTRPRSNAVTEAPAKMIHGRIPSPARSSLNAQIQGFNKSSLNKPRPQQRYMVSPHDNVSNMMNNLRGFGSTAQTDSNPMVRPVFKDDKQRGAFNQMAQQRLNALGSKDKLTSDSDKRDHATYSQMANWSTKDNAMMNFSGVDKKRSHPVVYVQGHGAPGDTNIYSDSHEKSSAQSVGGLLSKMDLPNVSEVRANSCHSGTQYDLNNSKGALGAHVNQTLDLYAGKRDQSFAGALDNSLQGQSDKRHNRVVGYLGPTSQGPMNVYARDKLGKFGVENHQAVLINNTPLLRSQATNKGPSVKGPRTPQPTPKTPAKG